MHELFSEIQLLWMVLSDRPEFEGIDDAHIQQPPYQARPAPTGLSADGVRVVKLIHDIDRAGMVELVMNCLRTADRNCKRAEVYSLDATVFQRFGNGQRRDGSV